MSHTHRPAAITRRRLLSAIASAAALSALAACACGVRAHHQGLVSLEVSDRDTGQVIPTHHHDGRRFVPGRPGARYALRLRNLSHARVLVVLSVDGVNVISGETADWRQAGYVLDPGRSADINGWRKSGTEVAAFEFAPIARSYAAQTGRPDNVGVIGLAAFRERIPVPPPAAAPPIAARSEGRAAEAVGRNAQGAAPSPSSEKSAAADATSSRLGTGHGQREWSVSHRTAFERASSTPEQMTQIEYDSYERLVAAGVIPDPTAYARPRPFPSSQAGFVPDPPAR